MKDYGWWSVQKNMLKVESENDKWGHRGWWWSACKSGKWRTAVIRIMVCLLHTVVAMRAISSQLGGRTTVVEPLTCLRGGGEGAGEWLGQLPGRPGWQGLTGAAGALDTIVPVCWENHHTNTYKHYIWQHTTSSTNTTGTQVCLNKLPNLPVPGDWWHDSFHYICYSM